MDQAKQSSRHQGNPACAGFAATSIASTGLPSTAGRPGDRNELWTGDIPSASFLGKRIESTSPSVSPGAWGRPRGRRRGDPSGTWASSRFGRYTLNDLPRGLRAPPTRVRLVQLSEIGSNGTYSIGSASSRASGSSREREQCLPLQGAFRRGCRAESNGQGCDRPDPPFTRLSLTWAKSKRAATCSTRRCKARRSGTTRRRPRVSSRS